MVNKDPSGDVSLKIGSEEPEHGFLTYKVELIKLSELTKQVKTTNIISRAPR